ncbi:hypothetical protein Q9966_003565, partial [Columba livia]
FTSPRREERAVFCDRAHEVFQEVPVFAEWNLSLNSMVLRRKQCDGDSTPLSILTYQSSGPKKYVYLYMEETDKTLNDFQIWNFKDTVHVHSAVLLWH